MSIRASFVIRHSSFVIFCGAAERVLQQNRMPRLQLRRQQTERRDHRQIDPILDCNKFRPRGIVHARDGFVVSRINLNHTGVFKNNLRLVIAHPLDLVRDFFMLLFANDNPHQFVTADLHAFGFQLFRRAPLIREWIEGNFRPLIADF